MFSVFGYDDLCSDFTQQYATLFRAARAFIRLDRSGQYVVFLRGVSNEQYERIRSLAWRR